MNNAQKALYAKMIQTANVLPVSELKRVILKDYTLPILPEEVFNSLMDALESKIGEEEFKAFLDGLE